MTDRDCSVFDWRAKPSIFAKDKKFTWKKPEPDNVPKGPGITLSGSRNGTTSINTETLSPSAKTTRIRRGGV